MYSITNLYLNMNAYIYLAFHTELKLCFVFQGFSRECCVLSSPKRSCDPIGEFLKLMKLLIACLENILNYIFSAKVIKFN